MVSWEEDRTVLGTKRCCAPRIEFASHRADDPTTANCHWRRPSTAASQGDGLELTTAPSPNAVLGRHFISSSSLPTRKWSEDRLTPRHRAGASLRDSAETPASSAPEP